MMKIRNGFVSNSSSSSFILASKPNEKIKVEIEIDPSKYLCSYINDGELISTIEQLDAVYQKEWIWNEELEEKFKTESMEQILKDMGEDWAAERYEKSKEAIESGMSIYNVSFSNESYNDPVESMMYEMTVDRLKQLVDETKIKVIGGDY